MSMWSDLGIFGEPLSFVDVDRRVVVALHWNAFDPLSWDALRALGVLQARCVDRPVVCLPIHAALPGDRVDGTPVEDVLCGTAPGLRRDLVCEAGVLRELGIEGLPTMTLIGPDGVVRARVSGVPDVERVLPAIDQLALTLDDGEGSPVGLDEVWSGSTRQALPVGLAIDEARGLLWVAQSDRHRIVALALEDGRVVEVVGGHASGSSDGAFEIASFASPSGVAVADGRVYVTDDVDHVVRCVDPDRRVVSRVLGCGHARQDTLGGQTGFDQGLVSPRGPSWAAGLLVFANTGTDQLFLMHEDGFALPFVGDGRRGSGDGHREDTGCDLPVATAAQGDEVAWVDAGSGALRTCGISTGHVEELIAPGRELGRPSGLCWYGDQVLVTDAEGGRVLSVDIRHHEVVEVAGSLGCPGAIVVHDDLAYVSLAGDGAVRRIDLSTGEIRPFGEALTDEQSAAEPPEIVVRRESDLTLSLDAPWPDGEQVAADDRAWISIRSLAADVDGLTEITAPLERVAGSDSLCLRAVRSGIAERAATKIRLFAVTRSDYHGADHVQEFEWTLTVVTDPDGPEEVEIPDLRPVR